MRGVASARYDFDSRLLRYPSHWRHNSLRARIKWFCFNHSADEPVSRILYGAALAARSMTIIPLASASRPGSSDLPEGLSFRSAYASRNGAHLFERAQRAGPALPSYLVLHHAGFAMPAALLPPRWALTPPFHPCLALRTIRRHPEGFPPGYHRVTLRRRFVLCGAFRDAAASSRIPWRYQARCPEALPKGCPSAKPFSSLLS